MVYTTALSNGGLCLLRSFSQPWGGCLTLSFPHFWLSDFHLCPLSDSGGLPVLYVDSLRLSEVCGWLVQWPLFSSCLGAWWFELCYDFLHLCLPALDITASGFAHCFDTFVHVFSLFHLVIRPVRLCLGCGFVNTEVGGLTCNGFRARIAFCFLYLWNRAFLKKVFN